MLGLHLIKLIMLFVATASMWGGFKIITADRACQGLNCVTASISLGWTMLIGGAVMLIFFLISSRN